MNFATKKMIPDEGKRNKKFQKPTIKKRPRSLSDDENSNDSPSSSLQKENSNKLSEISSSLESISSDEEFLASSPSNNTCSNTMSANINKRPVKYRAFQRAAEYADDEYWRTHLLSVARGVFPAE